jgi:hypothetical protein
MEAAAFEDEGGRGEDARGFALAARAFVPAVLPGGMLDIEIMVALFAVIFVKRHRSSVTDGELRGFGG